MFHILLVEDDTELREIITDYFMEKSEGMFSIDSADNGNLAQSKLYECEYDLILLDVMLPEVNGFTICREVRRNSDVPIVFITARQNESDRLHGYQLGCDDYIAKPLSLAELYAKVMALIKRAKGLVRNEAMTIGKIRMNPYQCSVHVDDNEVTLAAMEFAILKILMENKGQLVSRESLILKIWGWDYSGNERVVDNHVKKLRKSLGVASKQLKTVFKQGYKLEVQR